MSLIIGIRCKDGCLVIADKRSHVNTNGVISYDDGFEKIAMNAGFIVYNHGYNRIDDKDWKLRRKDLTPDKENVIYEEIAKEMKNKRDKTAFYVFIKKKAICEIRISADEGVSYIDHRPRDRIVSGTGGKYVKLGLLKDLQQKKCKKVASLLKQTFLNAYEGLVKGSGDEFCKEYTIQRLLG